MSQLNEPPRVSLWLVRTWITLLPDLTRSLQCPCFCQLPYLFTHQLNLSEVTIISSHFIVLKDQDLYFAYFFTFGIWMGIHFSSTITFLNEQFKTCFASDEHLNVQICVSFHFVSNLIRRKKLCCSLHFYSIGFKRFRDVVSCKQRRQAHSKWEDTCTLRFLSQVDFECSFPKTKNSRTIYLSIFDRITPVWWVCSVQHSISC